MNLATNSMSAKLTVSYQVRNSINRSGSMPDKISSEYLINKLLLASHRRGVDPSNYILAM
jgi:hypothetical protein